MDEIRFNATIFRSDKNEYIVRVFLEDHPLAYLVFKQHSDPIFVPNVDERRVAAHRWPRASINQTFSFEDWPKSDLTGGAISRIKRLI